jgi:predicted O-methyltransferase YrrM
MLDERVRSVLARLEEEETTERAQGVARELRGRAVAPTTGRFLFALAAAQPECIVLEIGASRGYSTIWFAAGARLLGGRVVSLESDPRKIAAWRHNVADAGLDEWTELVEGDAFKTLPLVGEFFDIVFIDAEKDDYEALFELARAKVEPGGLVIADNVVSHADTLGAYSAARQADPLLVSVTVPLDRGLELSAVVH